MFVDFADFSGCDGCVRVAFGVCGVPGDCNLSFVAYWGLV